MTTFALRRAPAAAGFPAGADTPHQIIAHNRKILCPACHVIHDEAHPDPKKANKRGCTKPEKKDVLTWIAILL